ncbi:hypothetical protein EV652_103378 [Kribbella steppae]|uniref:Uncharacterized protein n=1 Tax=Kribbella steppae TaxID=2512223 RepID=A0A4R2HQN5_9ACTN|nr:hypothetical protein [Kribbella steppae]TCO33377.1 hypothetical protein EV652_103378 [Kribbella steppae]
MTIKARLSGEPDDIAHLVAHLRGRFEVAGGDRAYPNRGSFGVRVYLEVRTHRPDTAEEETAKEIDR